MFHAKKERVGEVSSEVCTEVIHDGPYYKPSADISGMNPPHCSDCELLCNLRDRQKTFTIRYIIDDPTFETYATLYQRGLEYEKHGETERALDYYLYILLLFAPCGTSYYERPAIILEKMKKYDLAILVCKLFGKAVKACHCDPDLVQHRIDRLVSKKGKG